jgi:hypothetical protein
MFGLKYDILAGLEKIEEDLPTGLDEGQAALIKYVSNIQIEKAKEVVRAKFIEHELRCRDQERSNQNRFQNELLRYMAEIAKNTR